MTVGVKMVGDHVNSWRSLGTPTTEASASQRVIAGEELPRGSSVSFNLREVEQIVLNQSKFRNLSPKRPTIHSLKVILMDNTLSGCGTSTYECVNAMSLAEDVHTESARFSFNPSEDFITGPSFTLTLTKSLKKEDEISFWFSSEMAAAIGLPFLNFSHIKDGKYVCPKCQKSFLAPNPLKLHLASSCDVLSSDFLWSRIFGSLTSLPSTWKLPQFSLQRNVFLSKGLSFLNGGYYNHSDPSLSSYPLSSVNNMNLEAQIGGDSLAYQTNWLLQGSSSHQAKSSARKLSSSAFKPVISSRASNHPIINDHLSAIASRPSNPFQQPYHSLPLFGTLSNDASFIHSSLWSDIPKSPLFNHSALTVPSSSSSSSSLLSLPSTSSSDPCADVEAFVSNLGRGKGNHLCIYCGKVYSRKYGLKIHIRTHTGYKPLKCRVCLRPFGDPSNLNKHVRLHAQGETPYGCELCGKVLVRRRDLDRHLRSRHPDRVVAKNQNRCSKEEESSDQRDKDDHIESSAKEEATRTEKGTINLRQDSTEDVPITLEAQDSLTKEND